MDGSQNIFASSTSQQINSENIEGNASRNICARTFHTNRGLLQHLNFLRRRNITSNGNQTTTNNNNNTSNSNNSNGNDIPNKIESQEKKFYWNLVAGSTFKKDLCTGRRTCLCYHVAQLGKGMPKKSHVS